MVVDGPDFDGVYSVEGVYHLLAHFDYFTSRAEADHPAVCVAVAGMEVSSASSKKTLRGGNA